MKNMVRNVDKNEPAYWTNEVAERLGQGDSTIRKWSLALEEQGHEFLKGEQERRLFLEDDIHILSLVKEELKRQENNNEKKDLKVAAEFACNKWRTRLVPVERERTIPVPQNTQFDYEGISKMLVQEVVQEVNSFWINKFEESERRHEERESFLLKKIEEHQERHSLLMEKHNKELQEIKEEQKVSKKLIESNIELQKTIQKTDQMFEEVMKEMAAAKENTKKKWWKKLFSQ